MAPPDEAHRIMKALRTQHEEDILDLVRETIEQLTILGDRLEVYVRDVPDQEADDHDDSRD